MDKSLENGGRGAELQVVIEQITSLSQKERAFIDDLQDHFRRMVLHFGKVREFLALLRKSIQHWQWQDQGKMQHLLKRLQAEVDPRRGIVTGAVYKYMAFAPIHRLEKEKLQEEEKLTFQSYDTLAGMLKHSPHHPKTATTLKQVEVRLARALRQEKIVLSLSVHLDSLLEKFRQTLSLWQSKLEEEKILLDSLQPLLAAPLKNDQIPLLREYVSKLQEHLRYGRQLQVDFNEKFYKPFRKFIEEKFSAEERLQLILEGRKHWYQANRIPKITREDFVLDYYTLTSPEDVLYYIAALESLGPECIAPDLQKFLRTNKKRLIDRVRGQKATLVQSVFSLGKDRLTGLYARRTIEERLAEQFEISQRNKLSFSLLLADIDFFKSINDTYGHPAGDAVLQGVARALQEVLRKYDLAGRYGGEEFLIILPNSNKAQAAAVAERMRLNVSVRNQEPVNPTTKGPITISIGLATFPEDGSTAEVLIQAADQALYRAKKKGRNVVVAA